MAGSENIPSDHHIAGYSYHHTMDGFQQVSYLHNYYSRFHHTKKNKAKKDDGRGRQAGRRTPGMYVVFSVSVYAKTIALDVIADFY